MVADDKKDVDYWADGENESGNCNEYQWIVLARVI